MEEKSMERMRELVSLLNKASQAYYAQDTEIMSNYEYDRLYDAQLLRVGRRVRYAYEAGL